MIATSARGAGVVAKSWPDGQDMDHVGPLPGRPRAQERIAPHTPRPPAVQRGADADRQPGLLDVRAASMTPARTDNPSPLWNICVGRRIHVHDSRIHGSTTATPYRNGVSGDRDIASTGRSLPQAILGAQRLLKVRHQRAHQLDVGGRVERLVAFGCRHQKARWATGHRTAGRTSRHPSGAAASSPRRTPTAASARPMADRHGSIRPVRSRRPPCT